MDANFNINANYDYNTTGTVDYSDPGLTRDRRAASQATWNKNTQAQRNRAKKAMEARGEWKGGDRAQKSIERGSS